MDPFNLFLIMLLIVGFIMVIIAVAGISKYNAEVSAGVRVSTETTTNTTIGGIDKSIEKMEDTILKADLAMEDLNQKSEKVLESFEKKQQQLLNLYDTMEMANSQPVQQVENGILNNGSRIDITVDDKKDNNINKVRVDDKFNEEKNIEQLSIHQEILNKANNNNSNSNANNNINSNINNNTSSNVNDNINNNNSNNSNSNSANNNKNFVIPSSKTSNTLIKEKAFDISHLQELYKPKQYHALDDDAELEFREEILDIFSSASLNTNLDNTPTNITTNTKNTQQNKALQNTEHQFLQIKDLLEQGLTIPQIAKDLNIGQGQIEFILGLRKDYL